MQKLSPNTISALREDKRSGLSLSQIASKYHCSKGTASLYCRDLYTYPTRKFQTETEARKRKLSSFCLKCGKPIKAKKTGLCIDCYCPSRNKTTGSQPHEHGYKLVPCKHCGKLIRPRKNGLCQDCFYIELGKKRQPIKRRESHIIQSDNNYNPSQCPNSPTRAHHWFIDSDNLGTCHYCHLQKQMDIIKKPTKQPATAIIYLGT